MIGLFFHIIFDVLAGNFTGFIGNLFDLLSLQTHFESISRGVIDSQDLVYFISVSILSLLLAEWSLSNRHFQKNSKTMKKNTTSILLIVGILIIFNLLSVQYYFRIDLTEDKQYTLSESTKNIMESLDEPITVKAYFSENLPPNIARTKKKILKST